MSLVFFPTFSYPSLTTINMTGSYNKPNTVCTFGKIPSFVWLKTHPSLIKYWMSMLHDLGIIKPTSSLIYNYSKTHAPTIYRHQDKVSIFKLYCTLVYIHEQLSALSHRRKITKETSSCSEHQITTNLHSEKKKHLCTWSEGSELCWHLCTHHFVILNCKDLYTVKPD
jgi:hypothetical protein